MGTIKRHWLNYDDNCKIDAFSGMIVPKGKECDTPHTRDILGLGHLSSECFIINLRELDWWKTYREYVSKVHPNADAEACGYADGDNEYKDNF